MAGQNKGYRYWTNIEEELIRKEVIDCTLKGKIAKIKWTQNKITS